jgi:hypothetical protein
MRIITLYSTNVYYKTTVTKTVNVVLSQELTHEINGTGEKQKRTTSVFEKSIKTIQCA